MSRRQWMWLWTWLLLFFIIFCVWIKLKATQDAREKGMATAPIVTQEPQQAKPEKLVTKDISLKLTKENENIKINGVFPSQQALDKAIASLKPAANSVEKGTIIIDREANNPHILGAVGAVAKALSSFKKGVVEYHDRHITIEGTAPTPAAQKALLQTVENLDQNFTVTNLTTLQPAPKKPQPHAAVAPLPATQAKPVAAQETTPAVKAENKAAPAAEPTHQQASPKASESLQAKLNRMLQGQRIQFRFASDRLTKKSQKVLDRIATLLQQYPDTKIEIAGHTDSDGPAARNMKLSLKRAQSVKKYLIQRGIEPARLVAKGYGESRPLVKNDTPAHKRLNRRVEFSVIH